MKRVAMILLAVCLLLCGCKKKDTYPTLPTETTQPTEPTQETTAPTVPPETKPKEVLYRHPLTGAPLDAPWSGKLVAVMVNNLNKSMPQHGISQADIVYEIQEEGSVTRNMAIFSDLSDVGSIGSVRSARTYFVSVAASFDAYLVHCGTSVYAYGGKYDSTGKKVPDWKDIDQFYNSQYFFRDSDRANNGYAWEHTLFTTGERLTQALEGKADSNASNGFGLKFAEDVVLEKGEKAEEVVIKFKGTKTSTFIYNAETKLYERSQYGGNSIDGNTGDTVSFKNVIAVYTKQWGVPGSNGGHQYYETIGSGKGYAAINGKIVPILWSRKDVKSPYTYTLEDGTPLTLNVGTTYIAVVGEKFPIEYK